METLNNYALKLASLTVEYYSIKKHCDTAGSRVLRCDATALHQAYADMVNAHDMMEMVAEELAE